MLRQGLPDPARFGPNAPTTIDDFLDRLRSARQSGYATVDQTFEAGLAGIAAPITRRSRGDVVGVLSIAGPSVRLTADRMLELATPLLAACAELSDI